MWRKPRSSNRKAGLQRLACLALMGGLGACTDYLNHRDRVSYGAGDAQAWNTVVHVTDPWPRSAWNTSIPGQGQRTARVIRGYMRGQSPAPNGSTLPSPGPLNGNGGQ